MEGGHRIYGDSGVGSNLVREVEGQIVSQQLSGRRVVRASVAATG